MAIRKKKEKRLSVLVLLDDPQAAMATAESLNNNGFNCTWTSDPAQALKKAERRRFQVIVMDIIAKGAPCSELAPLFRLTQPERAVVVIGNDKSEISMKMAGAAAAEQYVVRPVSGRELGRLVRAANKLGRNRAGKDSQESLPVQVHVPIPGNLSLQEFTHEARKQYLTLASKTLGGDPRRMAKRIGCSLASMYRHIHDYDIPFEKVRLRSEKKTQKKAKKSVKSPLFVKSSSGTAGKRRGRSRKKQ